MFDENITFSTDHKGREIISFLGNDFEGVNCQVKGNDLYLDTSEGGTPNYSKKISLADFLAKVKELAVVTA